jgi:hypothetical protein
MTTKQNKLSYNELMEYLVERDNNENSECNSILRRLIIGLVTPEWFYSESTRIGVANKISWSTFNIRNHVVGGKIGEINTEYKDYFEKSFSSWYQPYHLLPRDRWGIHVRRDSIRRITSRFSQNCDQFKNDIDYSMKAAFLYIFFHHLYHHLIENMITFMEKRYNDPDLYTKYYNETYAKSLHSTICVEEVLCIQYIFERLKEVDKKCLKSELISSFSYNSDFKLDNIASQKKLLSFILTNSEELSKSESNQIGRYTDIDNYEEYKIPVWIHGVPKPVFGL